ncbi:methionyl-tRNA formyltransferase [Sphingomonas vulcanisoli]|uniref:Methionyl-tRNA formyltransferase n=1 Tax=Sphingomonas vulcanisoli TaxID=1658060 RepID=A0ABX0TUM3_9SPHN|nr:methionyl-tRNA formyltransferase [Sphingomonas vulcanisoli]NIJ07286.1 methionyl-tRNA formyltransferase [Sphingomonas vulcanisoli]
MRIAFMGTPDFAVPTLEALVAAGHDVAAVYTQPPRPAGRGKAPQKSPVQLRAEALGIAVRSPGTLRDAEAQAAFAALDLDVAAVAAYGLILPQPVLDAPRHGCLNVHGSLLPRWRGAAPVQRAILAGDEETGLTIMQMEKGLDTGPMLLKRATPIGAKTAGDLTAELAAMGAAMMIEVLADLPAFTPVIQPEGATHAAKVDKAEARLDFSQSAEQVERQIRAFTPAPGAWFEVGGERIRVLSADVLRRRPEPGLSEAMREPPALRPAPEYGVVLDDQLAISCGTGAIRPTRVQRAGKSAMATGELLRGFTIPAGTRLA